MQSQKLGCNWLGRNSSPCANVQPPPPHATERIIPFPGPGETVWSLHGETENGLIGCCRPHSVRQWRPYRRTRSEQELASGIWTDEWRHFVGRLDQDEDRPPHLRYAGDDCPDQRDSNHDLHVLIWLKRAWWTPRCRQNGWSDPSGTTFYIHRLTDSEQGKDKGRYSPSWEPHLRARHLPYGITQCSLPPPNPAMQAGTRFTYPGGMEGWVNLVDLIAPRSGVEPATFRSRVRRRTAAPPRQPNRQTVQPWEHWTLSLLHTCGWIAEQLNKF